MLKILFYITCFFVAVIAFCTVFNLNIDIDKKHFKLKIETSEGNDK